MGAYPQVADWNEDGKKDLLVGDRNGYVTLFLNVGTNSNPQLTNTGHIQVSGSDLNVGLNASPVVVDWNNDGKKDLVTGNDPGYIYLLLNQGTNAAPVFNTITTIKSSSTDIYRWRASPEIYDLDQDGKKDLIVSDYYGDVHYYRNTGTDANPAFSGSTHLQAGTQSLQVVYGAYTDLADWDEDGDIDFIIGDWYAYLNLFRNKTISSGVVPADPTIPLEYHLYANFPNPFNMSTRIPYDLPKAGQIEICIHDVQGRRVRIIKNGWEQAGQNNVIWDGRTSNGSIAPSGLYIVRMRAEGYSASRKIILNK
jgi:hypothetical protein